MKHPKAWSDGVMPLDEFPDVLRDTITAAIARPDPPPKWIDFGLARIISRAWCEWHWARGLDPREADEL